VITVVGSLNMDLFIETPHLPAAGETQLGTKFRRAPGGKGANQACAAARMRQPVVLIGAVGRDAFGEEMVHHLFQFHVGTEGVARRDDADSGVAFIIVDTSGQNQIVVAPGANATLTARDVTHWRRYISPSKAVITQLESPRPAVEAALRLARDAGALSVLNPAPYAPLSDNLLRLCDWIIPNEIEAAQLTGLKVRNQAEAEDAARKLRERAGGANIAITLGPDGVWITSRSFSGHVAAPTVTPVDTVGAGDTFIGAFVARLTERANVRDAAHFACAAASLSVTRRGAQSGIPSRDEVEAFLRASGDRSP
jgi:ribokinase